VPQTPRMQWPYPAEDQDPWYDDYVNNLAAADASGYAAREDRNLALAAGGEFTFTAATGVVTWSAPLEILSPLTAVVLTLPAGSVTLAAGVFGWVNLPRAPTQATALEVRTGPSVPSSDGALLLFVRRSDRVYVRGAKVLNDGDALTLFASNPGGNGALPEARVWVGDVSAVAVPRLLSGDATLDGLGALTIASDAVTAAKLLKSDTFDFATALGTVRVQDPLADTDAANKQWVLSSFPTRNAGKTVWVAQGDSRAQDAPRTGIALTSTDVPFETLTAAFAAITLAGLFGATVVVRAGYYDETGSVPDSVSVWCESQEVYIVRLVFDSGGSSSLIGGRIFNSASFGSSAVNKCPLTVDNGTTVRLYGVRAEDYETNTDDPAPPTLSIVNSAVSAYNCQFGRYHLEGGAGAGETRDCVMVEGASTFLAEQCTFFCATDAASENARAVTVQTSSTSSLVRLLNCQIAAALLHPAAIGRLYGLVATPTAVSKVEVIGGTLQTTAGVGANPGIISLIHVAAAALAQEVFVTGGTVLKCVGPTPNLYAASADDALNVVRLLGMMWPYDAVPFPVNGLNGQIIHTGVTRAGTPFPLSLHREQLSGKYETDGSVGAEVGTGEFRAILPSAWGDAPLRTFTFAVIAYVSNPAKALTVRLCNAATGVAVAAVSTISTSPAKLTAVMTVGVGPTDLQEADTNYEVRYELDAGVFADKGKLTGAWLEVR
jgi:hypothetical protein